MPDGDFVLADPDADQLVLDWRGISIPVRTEDHSIAHGRGHIRIWPCLAGRLQKWGAQLFSVCQKIIVMQALSPNASRLKQGQ